MAEAFNNYFINIGPSLAHEMAHSSLSFESFVKPSHSELSEFRTVANANVQKEGLSLAKATGIDNISGKILKVAALAISSSLTYIINHAIISCCFPDDWKVARVLPLHKKGPRNLPNNYRPISIFPAISKITERILYDQLHNYLSANDILCERQFGVRRLHSTASALLGSTNSWYLNVDRKMFNLVLFLDLKKAFLTVNHEILLREMEIYGVTGNALNLMKSYLRDRKQICQINGVSSTENRIGCEIPQGSILGPLFFLLYINGLPECLRQTTPRLFADDTNRTASGKPEEEVEKAMNGDPEYVKKWLLANKLSLNVAKTEFLLIGSHYSILTITAHPSIGIGHNFLNQVTYSKVLVVEIDQFLSCDKHVDSIAKKLTSSIGTIWRIREFVDRETLVAVHNAIVQPHFNYCSEVWDSLGEGLSKRLQTL